MGSSRGAGWRRNGGRSRGQPRAASRGRRRALAAALVALGCGVAVPGRAQEGAGQPGQGGPDLASQVVDPTSALTTITLQDRYSPSLWHVDGDHNEVDLQVGIPFKAFGAANILRVILPYQTHTPSGVHGLGDVSVFDIVVIRTGFGKLAAGAVASLGVPKGEGADTYAMGPALGVVMASGKWTYGLFNQNLFSGDDIALSQLQPILAYTVNPHVSLALGDLQYTVDWNEGGFVLVPLGMQLNVVTALARQPVRLFVNPQYNLQDEPGSRKWFVTGGLALIVR